MEFGRKTGMGTAVQMLEWYKKQSVTATRAKDMSPEELRDKIVVGELVDIEKPELMETMAAMQARAMAAAGP